MRFKLTAALLVAASAEELDCSHYEVYTGRNPPDQKIVYMNKVYQGQWLELNDPPTQGNAWKYLADCKPGSAPSLQPLCDSVLPYGTGCVYTVSQLVLYNNAVYKNKWWANTPPNNDGNWVVVGICPGPSNTTTIPPTTPPTTSSTTTTQTPRSTTTTTMQTPRSTTTTMQTTRPTTTTTMQTTRPTTTTTMQTPRPTTTTTPSSQPPSSDYPDKRPSGASGPNGECVWPAFQTGGIYQKGQYISMNGLVYEAQWYQNSPPPGDGGWKQIGSCSGSTPGRLTDADILAKADKSATTPQQILDPWNPLLPTATELSALETSMRQGEAIGRAIAAARLLPASEVEKILPKRAENPENVRRVEQLLPEESFAKLFPVAHVAYTYTNLLRAIGLTPEFCKTYTDGRDSDTLCKLSLATSFAHVAQETGAHWPSLTGATPLDADHTHPATLQEYPGTIPQAFQGAYFVREQGHEENVTDNTYGTHCQLGGDSDMWMLNYWCYPNRGYFGRGAKQVTYGYNYGYLSRLLYGDANYLLQNPHLVAESWVNFASATWFFVTPQSPKPSMQQVINGDWVPNDADKANGMTNSFGATISIINGGLECGTSTPSAQATNRKNFFLAWAKYFNLSLDMSQDLDCSRAKGFQPSSSAAYTQYWRPAANGAQNCEATNEQTPFMIALQGDLERCVNFFFRGHTVMNGKIVAHYGKSGA